MFKAFFSFLCLFTLGLLLPASAGVITLETKLTSKIVGQQLKIEVNSLNKENEAAYNMRAKIKVGDKTILAAKLAELPVGEIYHADIQSPVPSTLPGTYPFVLTLEYTDANQAPFSVLIINNLIIEKNGSPHLIKIVPRHGLIPDSQKGNFYATIGAAFIVSLLLYYFLNKPS